MPASELHPTSPSDWNSPRKKGFLTQLPCGSIARVRKAFNIALLVKTGKIPNPLGEHIRKAMESGEQAFVIGGQSPIIEQIQFAELIDQCAVDIMVDPRVEIPPEVDENGEPVDPETWEPSPGALSIMDLGSEDKVYLFHVGTGGAADLETFRAQQAQLVLDVVDGAGVQVPPEHVDRPKRARSGGKRN